MGLTVREQFSNAQSKEKREQVKADPNRLRYHLMAPVGWLNDPNGLCEFNGVYNIFYQYTPGSPDGQDHRGWGHYQTKDFIHYQEMDDPFVPDTHADATGSYSGSALVRDGKMHLFFTGNNKLPGNYDYINEGRIHWVLHSQSEDGETFSPKEVLLKNEDYPSDLSCHVRDPKILSENGKDYMVLGARTKDGRGQAEIFESTDLRHWKHCSTIRPKTPFGYMWECPDLFELDGHRILITCPQGVRQDGILYENLYQNGWFEADGSLEKDQTVDGFTELDNGFDFYAPQSFLDEKGRRILIGWMGIPDVDYTCPTVKNGWQHALTLPRKLKWQDGLIIQEPIEELEALRQEEITVHLNPGECLQLQDRVFELDLKTKDEDLVLNLRSDCTLSYDRNSGIMTLALAQSGYGRTSRHVRLEKLESIRIFSDTSSLEIFINGGKKVFTTRLFDQQGPVRICSSNEVSGKAWMLGSFEIEEKLEKTDPAA